jgi:hypothetical protein
MQIVQLVFVFLSFFISSSSLAGDKWTTNLNPEYLLGNYPGSPIRENITLKGANANFQYLDKFGFALGDTRLNINLKYNIPTVVQDIGYVSFHYNLKPDSLPGTLTLRLDAYKIWGNDPTEETDGATIGHPIVSFLNDKHTLYLDLGYAYSQYGTSAITLRGLDISQIKSTVGFGFNQEADWLYYKLYAIYSSNSERSHLLSHTYGTEVSLKHAIKSSYFLVPQEIVVGVFLGEKIYTVDEIAMIIYNFGDLQKNSIFFQTKWNLTSNIYFLLNVGSQNYNTLINNSFFPYKLNYVYGGLNFKI